MNFTEALARALEEPTLAKALSWIAVWETERVVVQARNNPQWETCFEYSFKQVIERYKEKQI